MVKKAVAFIKEKDNEKMSIENGGETHVVLASKQIIIPFLNSTMKKSFNT